MASDAEALSELIGNVYDTVLDHAQWPDALRRICDFVRASSANIYAQDSSQSTNVTLYHRYGDDPYYAQLYIDSYADMNPFYPALTFQEVGRIHSLSDFISYDEFRETRFYKEWVRPQGQVDALVANLDKSATGSAVISARRNECDGLVDDEARRRMALVVPHVRRAVLVGKVLDFHKAEATTLVDTFAGLAAGVFLVDPHARIVFANAAGEMMLGDGRIIRTVHGRLVAVDVDADHALGDIFAVAASGDSAVGIKGVAVALPASGDAHHVAHVLPLTSGARQRAGITYSAAAAVFVRKAAPYVPSPMEAVASLYRLTASEVRVLQAVVEIGGVPAVADALGISEGTVKTHLHRVFAKTGLERQVDLVKLLARHASPLRQ